MATTCVLRRKKRETPGGLGTEVGRNVACRSPTGPEQGWLGCVQKNDQHQGFSLQYIIYAGCMNLYNNVFI